MRIHLFENNLEGIYTALKDDAIPDQALQERMNRLSIPLPAGNAHHESMEKNYHQVVYQFENNRYGFQKISFDFSEKGAEDHADIAGRCIYRKGWIWQMD